MPTWEPGNASRHSTIAATACQPVKLRNTLRFTTRATPKRAGLRQVVNGHAAKHSEVDELGLGAACIHGTGSKCTAKTTSSKAKMRAHQGLGAHWGNGRHPRALFAWSCRAPVQGHECRAPRTAHPSGQHHEHKPGTSRPEAAACSCNLSARHCSRSPASDYLSPLRCHRHEIT